MLNPDGIAHAYPLTSLTHRRAGSRCAPPSPRHRNAWAGHMVFQDRRPGRCASPVRSADANRCWVTMNLGPHTAAHDSPDLDGFSPAD